MPTGVAIAGGARAARFKSGLLVGASALAIVVSSVASAQTAPAQTAPADQPKWSANVSVAGQLGDQTSGLRITGFDPIWQDLNSLLYVRLGLGTQTRNNEIGNLGLGYRTKLNNDWIAGFYAGFDADNTRYGHYFSQVSFGGELMNSDWDVRANGYIPLQQGLRDTNGAFKLYIHDTTIAILQGQESAYSGFDGEVGYRVYNTDDMDLRAFVGGFNFDGANRMQTSGGKTFNLGPGSMSGPLGRVEATIYGIKPFGARSRLIFNGEVTNDKVRGTTGYVGVSLQFTLDGSSTDTDYQDELDRRMVDPVRRNDFVTSEEGLSKPEPVIIYNGTITSEPTNTLYYVDNHTGAGTYANPTTLHDATSRGPVNQFVVLTDRDGPVNAAGVVVQSGESVVGPGTFTVRGAHSGTKITHDFAPGSGPVTVNTADGITLDSNTNLFGFTIDSTAPNAIYGHNVNDVVIGSLTINGGGVGANGIYIHQDAGHSGSVSIYSTTIAGVTNDGILANLTNATGSTDSFKLNVTGATIHAGHDGIEVTSTTSGGSTDNIYAGVHGSTITAGNTDVSMIGTVFAGSTLNQDLVVDPTTLTGGLYGLVLGGISNGGTLNQTIDIDHVTVSGTTDAGIHVYGYAYNAGSLTQHVTMNQVTADGSYFPIAVTATALDDATLTQTVSLTSVTATNGKYDNLTIYGDAAYGATVHQTVTGSGITATGSLLGDGVFIRGNAYESGTLIQTVTLDHLTGTGNYGDGVGITAIADNITPGSSAVLAQYVTLSNATLTGNGYDGVGAIVDGADDSIGRQDVSITNSSLSNNGEFGILADAFGAFGGTGEQNIYLGNDTVNHNTLGGAYFEATGAVLGTANQTAYIEGGSFSNNGGDGITIYGRAFAAGQVVQNAGIYDVTATGNANDGLRVVNDAYGYTVGTYAYYSHIGQNVTAEGDNFSHNARYGVEVSNYAGYGAQVNQTVYLYNDHMDHEGSSGFYEKSTAMAYGIGGGAITTNLYANLYVVNSTADDNVIDGMRLTGTATGPTYMIQHIAVQDSDASNNGRMGLISYATAAEFYSLNIQYLTVAGSTFNANGVDGADFFATQHYGPLSFGAAIQDVTISNSTFDNNTRNGLFASAEAYQLQGRAEQHFTIQGSDFSYNGADGASFNAHAHDGVYLPGYTCDVAQGLGGGCAFVRETVQIVGSRFDYNTGNGISVTDTASNYGAIYNSSGRPANTPTLVVAYSDVSGNGADGLHITTNADTSSYVYSYFIGLGSTFNNNANHGVEVNSTATSGSTIGQKAILYGLPGYTSSADGNGGDGLHVTASASGGTVQQLVGVYYSDLSHNAGNGLSVSAYAGNGAGLESIVGQYIGIAHSVFYRDGTDGAEITSRTTDSLAAASQHVDARYSTFSGNGSDGLHAFAISYAGSSAYQSLYFAGDEFNGNVGDGVYVVGIAVDQASTKQIVNFNSPGNFTSYADKNLGDGIYVGTAAFSGASAYQSAFVYGVDASNNTGNGLSMGMGANGYGFGASYIYYSHVSQNLVAAYDSFDHNGGNGVSISNVLYYGGAANQLIQLASLEANNNGGAGFYSTNHLTSIRGNSFSFSTNLTTELYLIGTTTNDNGGNGIDIRSYANGAVYAPAFFGGYNYMVMHNTIEGVTSNGNTGSGLSMNTNTTGRYTLNGEYVTIAGSTFDNNTHAGASFTSTDYYGPGGFGVSLQQLTISGSDFSHNGGDGLDLDAFASGRQGRAEQHTTVTGSTMDYNGGDGVSVYASAINGVYIAGHPCTTAQGLPGGCAFVRQNTTIEDSDISHNGDNGVDVQTYANNYGAIYGASGRPHSPTLELYGDSVDYNGNRGLNVSNHVSGNSYLYQYNAMIDSTFDHNHGDGVYSASYVGGGSTMLQRQLLYTYHTGASAAYNGGNGFKSTIEALGASYARDVNIVEGADLSHDGSFGFDGAVAYADGASTGLQINAVYFNAINYNGDGVGLYSIGGGAQQISYIGGNEVGHNAFVGVYGEANFGAFQYIGVYTFGNNVHDNGTNYLFNAFGGSTQILH